MSTNAASLPPTAIAPIPTQPSITDPVLTEKIVEQHWPVEYDHHMQARIAAPYRGLSEETQNAVIEFWNLGYEPSALRLADCRRYGSVVAVSNCGQYAEGHRHTCHLDICEHCGKAEKQLHCWLRKRADRVWTERQVGVEIIGPRGSDVNEAARKLAKYLHTSTIRQAVVTPKGGDDRERIRMVVRTDRLPYHATLARLQALAGPEFLLQTKQHDQPLVLLKWMFSGTEGLLTYCGHLRVKLLLRFQKERKLRLHTTGKFYSPSKEKHEYHESVGQGVPCPCGCGIMVSIPWTERYALPLAEIEEKYPGGVKWNACTDGFWVNGRRVGRRAPTDNVISMSNYEINSSVNAHAPPG